ncbi:MAG TPA: HAMP domain-containing sensor histidine kinase [Verrucomicrobiae bacterium]|nr:HAMP domain-containing sensor histidine kinase [Verrucomicrobiae bacterium]
MNSSEPTQVTPPATRVPRTALDLEALNPRRRSRLARVLGAVGNLFERIIGMLKIAPPESAQVLKRIVMMERDIVLPIKAAGIAILFRYFYFTRWIQDTSTDLEVSVDAARYFFLIYVFMNAIFAAALLLGARRLRLVIIERLVFAMSLVDGIFLGVLTLVTGGYNSSLYWLFLGLIVRSAVSVPRATSQLLLNLTLSTCFVLAGAIDSFIAKNLDVTLQKVLDLWAVDNPAEPLLLRLVLLLLMTFGCYAVQVLLERQRQAEEEAREFAVREVQLHSAGRLAAEFAHQIKNPLAIINNAAYSLQRGLKEGKPAAIEQIEMIQEEVQRADRIVTEVMGYAQLSEGHVEKLDVLDELDHAIERVFPPAARFPIRVHRDYGPYFPPLLMLRRHASETFINVLQNAREALLATGGNVRVSARCHGDHSIEVSIQDDGPGIAPDKQGRIFEPYYTTKENGTGLGLASVKHNVELYGGRVRVESGLGKGARFVLLFPAKTLIRLAKSN